MLQHQ